LYDSIPQVYNYCVYFTDNMEKKIHHLEKEMYYKIGTPGKHHCVHLGPIVQKIYPLDKSYPLNKSSSIYTSYPVDKYLSSGYSFEQLGPVD
jgi:hypothetical protein